MKLGLGTVQFGQAYGVSNTRGQVSTQEAGAILSRAAQAGVQVLDTAANSIVFVTNWLSYWLAALLRANDKPAISSNTWSWKP